MANVVAFLTLACCGIADASLGSFLKSLPGKKTSNINYGDLCKSMGKTYQGYGWSMGGGATTIDVTCSGQQISLVCTGWPTFKECTTSSADGDSQGGCTCAKEHPKCSSKNGWCYSASGKAWSNTHCPGTCTESAVSECQCPSSYPFCYPKDKWCYASSSETTLAVSHSYTQKCGGECSAHGPQAPVAAPTEPLASECTCPTSAPFCYPSNQWCYKSASSKSYSQTCASKCTKSGEAPASPVAVAPVLTSGGSGSQVAKVESCNTRDTFSQSEAQEMLDLHNKFRCAVGTPPLQWNGALQCQAQETQDKIAAFSHSKSYGLPIAAGENLATGTSPSMAAWMWFTEYTQSSGTGHYTAMVWKAGTQVGCGIQRSGSSVIRCQYAAAAPNFGGATDFAANVPKFKGEKSKLEKCGLTINEVRKHVKQYTGWGILTPESALSASLGLFAESDDEHVTRSTASSGMTTAGVAFAVAAFALVGVVFVARRRHQHDGIRATLVACDEEEAAEMEEKSGAAE